VHCTLKLTSYLKRANSARFHWKDQVVNLVHGKIAVGGIIHKNKQYANYAEKCKALVLQMEV
jgi:hypothetical protein